MLAKKGKQGIKSIVLAPTRELAQQIYRVFKDIGYFTEFKYDIIHGGDSMERQFAKLLEFPDIIIATPGRLLHLLVEMDLKLSSVEYVVFDEADRLFEMGFHEQLNEILHRLPQFKQTLLFSATLPQQLVDFARAGLNDPELLRLDVESKLSENLRTVYVGCRFTDKLAVLMYLIKSIIAKEESTVVFVPTRHHVEYVRSMLEANLIESTFVFSALEQRLRNENVYKFKRKQVNVMIVTDLAARGIDIPILDNVINFNFPSKPKLFVHRVGRVARAGRYGTAYSIVSLDELPFVHELSLFLNHQFKIPNEHSTAKDDGLYGLAPQQLLDEENETIKKHLETKKDLKEMLKVCENAYKHYLKTREKPSGESVRKMKQYNNELSIAYHPIFKEKMDDEEEERKKSSLLDSLRNFKTNSTIFEIDRKKAKANSVINATRKYFQNVIDKKIKVKELEVQQDEFEKQTETADFKDDDHYLPYQSKDHYSEKGLQVNENRNLIQNSVFAIQGDEQEEMRKSRLNEKKWDRKKKKFVGEIEDIRAKKFKTESGNWISSSFKTDQFKRWKEKNKIEDSTSFENTVSFEETNNKQKVKGRRFEEADNKQKVKGRRFEEADNKQKLKGRNQEIMRMVSNKFKTKGMKGQKSELKDKSEIVKKRLIKQRHDKYQELKESRMKGKSGKSNSRSRGGSVKSNSRGSSKNNLRNNSKASSRSSFKNSKSSAGKNRRANSFKSNKKGFKGSRK